MRFVLSSVVRFLTLAVAALPACQSEPPTAPMPTRGALRVVARTTGATFDQNGYTLRVGTAAVALGIQDSMDMRDLPPGPVPLALEDVAVNCRILSLPSTVTIQSAQRTRVALEMSCDSALSNIILFQRGTGVPALWMMRPDGSQKILLVENASGGSLTPDGTRVVYQDWTTGRLTVIRVDRTRRWAVVPDLRTGQYQPDVSPDGRAVVFSASASEPWWRIYRANLDGTDIRELTATNDVDQDPRWSPDGRYIAFTRSSAGPDVQVFIMAADGSNPTPLTAKGEGCCPRWSPDGSRILFFKPNFGVGLWTMGPDGGNPQRLPEALDFASVGEWSPDGASLLVESWEDATIKILRVPLDGTDITVLADEGFNRLGRWFR